MVFPSVAVTRDAFLILNSDYPLFGWLYLAFGLK